MARPVLMRLLADILMLYALLALAFWPGWLQGNQSSRAQWWADRTKPLFR